MIIKVHDLEKDYREAFAAYCKRGGMSIVNYIIAGLFLAEAILFLSTTNVYWIGGVTLFLAFYFLASKWLYVRLMLKSVKTNKNFGVEEEFEFCEDGRIINRSEGYLNEFPISRFIYFIESKNYLLLFIKKHQYLFFNISKLEQMEMFDALKGLLTEFGIKQKKR